MYLFLLKCFSLLRKLYMPLFTSLVYKLSINKTLKKELPELFTKFKPTFPYHLNLHEFTAVMRKLQYKSDKLKGAFDITYDEPFAFLSETITSKWGRDCDDFAWQWYQYLKFLNWDEVNLILIMPKQISGIITKLHFIVVARAHDLAPYRVYENNFVDVNFHSGDDINQVLKEYFNRRKSVDESYTNGGVWTTYKD